VNGQDVFIRFSGAADFILRPPESSGDEPDLLANGRVMPAIPADAFAFNGSFTVGVGKKHRIRLRRLPALFVRPQTVQ
jgi:hypothetical protein